MNSVGDGVCFLGPRYEYPFPSPLLTSREIGLHPGCVVIDGRMTVREHGIATLIYQVARFNGVEWRSGPALVTRSDLKILLVAGMGSGQI